MGTKSTIYALDYNDKGTEEVKFMSVCSLELQ